MIWLLCTVVMLIYLGVESAWEKMWREGNDKYHSALLKTHINAKKFMPDYDWYSIIDSRSDPILAMSAMQGAGSMPCFLLKRLWIFCSSLSNRNLQWKRY